MKKLILLAALLVLPVTAHADQKVQGSGPSPYVECGIGAAIFPDLHWAAAISNSLWDLGTTAITSALSSPEMCNAKKVKTAQLIIETVPELEKDIAMGDGEYVTALADTMGCSASKDVIVAGMRSSYGATISNASYSNQETADRAENMYQSARGAAISAGCGAYL